MWHAEKIFICGGCRISCHKKCHSKVEQKCTVTDTTVSHLLIQLRFSKTLGRVLRLDMNSAVQKLQAGTGGRLFGAELVMLVDEDNVVPIVVERLMMAIELRALFVEGIYRKSGSVAQIRNLRKKIETSAGTRLGHSSH